MESGSRVGAYTVVAPLGAGGMGEVYRARDSRLNRDVALKILPAALAHDSDYLARFEREAQTLAALNHPNIAQIYGIEQNAIVMELVEGEDLKGPLPAIDVIRIARQIAEGLDAAHEKGIIHRDLKPANIKITPDGTVKILDFGLAKAMEPAAAASASGANSPTLTIRATQAGLILGTAAYMAPEQAAGKPVDKRADIWAYGVVLYELLTGKRLFDGETISHTLASVLKDPIPIEAVNAPPNIKKLLTRCLDRDRKTRLRDIGEALFLLNLNEAPQAVPAKPTKRSMLPWIAAACGLAAIPIGWFTQKPTSIDQPVLQLEIPPPPGVSLGPTSYNQLALSPDGTNIAFCGRDRDSKDKIFLRNMGSGATITIPGSENAKGPFWSPDSRGLSFFADGRIKRYELAGARLVDVAESYTAAFGFYHDDGNIYVSTLEHVLRRVPATGGTLTPVFDKQPELMTATPGRLTKDTFTVQILDAGPGRVAIASTSGVIGKQLLPQGNLQGSPALYAPNPNGGKGWLLHMTNNQLAAIAMDPTTGELAGSETVLVQNLASGPGWSTSQTGLLAFRKNGWGTDRMLTWVNRSGIQLGTVAERGNVFIPRISPDQSSVAFTRNDERGTLLYVHDLKRNTSTRVAVESSANAYGVWTPDGRSLVYMVRPAAVAIHPLDGSGGEKPLFKTARDAAPTGISPDGKWLTYYDPRVGVGRIFLGSIDTGNVKQIGTERIPLHHAEFSPDGKWLAYSAFVNGRWDVFVRPFPIQSEGQIQISPAGGNQPKWRADGREMFYVAAGGMLTAVPIEWTSAGPRAGAPSALFPTTLGMSIGYGREYDVTSDGKRFLLPIPPAGVQFEVPITVIVNWPKLLEKKP